MLLPVNESLLIPVYVLCRLFLGCGGVGPKLVTGALPVDNRRSERSSGHQKAPKQVKNGYLRSDQACDPEDDTNLRPKNIRTQARLGLLNIQEKSLLGFLDIQRESFFGLLKGEFEFFYFEAEGFYVGFELRFGLLEVYAEFVNLCLEAGFGFPNFGLEAGLGLPEF